MRQTLHGGFVDQRSIRASIFEDMLSPTVYMLLVLFLNKEGVIE